MKSLLGAMFLATSLLGGAVAGAGAEGELSPSAVEKATTAADHKAIADHYAKEAEEARKKAAEHKAMLAAYEKGPGFYQKSGFLDHCKVLISQYESAAKSAETMAKMHRDQAAQAK